EAEKALEAEREGERLAMLAWIRADAPKDAYEANSFALPATWNKEQGLTAAYRTDDGKGVKIRSLFNDRCVRCHGPGGKQSNKPLDGHAALGKYLSPQLTAKSPGQVAALPEPAERQPEFGLEGLAQSTHVHLLAFSMLYA